MTSDKDSHIARLTKKIQTLEEQVTSDKDSHIAILTTKNQTLEEQVQTLEEKVQTLEEEKVANIDKMKAIEKSHEDIKSTVHVK